jgi:hypothetical protein
MDSGSEIEVVDSEGEGGVLAVASAPPSPAPAWPRRLPATLADAASTACRRRDATGWRGPP